MGQTRPQTIGDPFWELVATARRLQAPGGCSWDRAQTVTSLLPYLIEETWEVFEVIRSRRYEELQEELGDVLYTVLFLALIAERRGFCRLESMLTVTRGKMVRRHPHVFGASRADSPRAAYRSWQRSKQLEGARRHSPSRRFRKRLVEWWDWLHAHPGAGRAAQMTGDASPPTLRSRARMTRVGAPRRRRPRYRATGEQEHAGGRPACRAGRGRQGLRPWGSTGRPLADGPGDPMPGHGERKPDRQT